MRPSKLGELKAVVALLERGNEEDEACQALDADSIRPLMKGWEPYQ